MDPIALLRKQIAERTQRATGSGTSTPSSERNSEPNSPLTDSPITPLASSQERRNPEISISIEKLTSSTGEIPNNEKIQQGTNTTFSPNVLVDTSLPLNSPRSPRLSREQLALGAELRSKLSRNTELNTTKEIPTPGRLRLELPIPEDRSVSVDRPTPSYTEVEKSTPRISAFDSGLSNKLKEYENEIKLLNEKLKLSQETNKSLSMENEFLKGKVQKFENAPPAPVVEDKSNYIRELEAKLVQRNEERKQYKTILKELQDTLEKRNKEKQELKDLLDRAKTQQPIEPTPDTKKSVKFEENSRTLETKLENEIKRRMELEREVEKREIAEINLKKEFEKTLRKISESSTESGSEYDNYNRKLETDLKTLRKRLEATILERDSVETAKYHLNQELNEKTLLYEKAMKEREKSIKEKDSMFEDLLEMQKRWQAELRDRKEVEQVNNSLVEYKIKYQQEWEQKIALETKASTLEREIVGYKKKSEMESRARKETEETNQMLERLIETMREKERSLLSTDISKRKPVYQEPDNEIYHLRIQELENVNAALQLKIESLHNKYTQEHLNLQESLRHNRELQRDLADLEDIREGSSDAKLAKAKKDNNRYIEEIEDLKRKLREESRKKDEILITKVKLEKSLQNAKSKLEKYQAPASPSASTSSSSPKSSTEYWKLKYSSKEELQSYTGELLNKLEDDTLHIIHLEQENERIKQQLSSSRHSTISRGPNGKSPKSFRVT